MPFSFVKNLVLIFIISLGIIGGCGGNIFGPSGEKRFIDCFQLSVEEKEDYRCYGNPGACCSSDFLFGTHCESDKGICCENEFPILCPDADICVQDLEQCPENTNSLTEIEVLQDLSLCTTWHWTFEPDQYFFTNSWFLEGFVSGPVGTELTYELIHDDFKTSTVEFRCQSWRDCIRSESSREISSWWMWIYVEDAANKLGADTFAVNEFELRIKANDTISTSLSLCPEG